MTNLARTMLLLPFLLRAAGAAPDPPSYEAAALGTVLETAQGRLRLVARDILISNPGTYGIPDEQLHYPWLYESTNGIWYLTYREGPHHEARFQSAGNRVRCVQSRDRGKTWLPWLGMKAEPWMYQFFVTRLADHSLISYRCKMTGLHQSVDASQRPDGTLSGTQILLRSSNAGATWKRSHVPVSNLPFSLDSALITFWGSAISMPDGRLLWSIITREGRDTRIGVVESTDGGRSFRFLSSICGPEVYDDVGEPREPAVVLLPRGDLVAVIRCNPMLLVRSQDGGRTWHEPRKLEAAGPAICPQLLLLENGILVCSYGSQRRRMSVIASWDGGGRHWTPPLVIYRGETSGYSGLQALGPDRFRVCYQEGSFLNLQSGGNRLVRVELTTSQ
ncbi:MAG: hypothetical protein CMJ59_23925 [Planctomycetaceae bacterium]|nr:hypothetical protein [Planctomycetaceae bacterium]